jgi:hypothetical protein
MTQHTALALDCCTFEDLLFASAMIHTICLSVERSMSQAPTQGEHTTPSHTPCLNHPLHKYDSGRAEKQAVSNAGQTLACLTHLLLLLLLLLPPHAPYRLGVDDADSYGQLAAFVQTVSTRGGVTDFAIHARKCLLNGISPAQNRSIPPLRHDWVWALKRDFPHLFFQVTQWTWRWEGCRGDGGGMDGG